MSRATHSQWIVMALLLNNIRYLNLTSNPQNFAFPNAMDDNIRLPKFKENEVQKNIKCLNKLILPSRFHHIYAFHHSSYAFNGKIPNALFRFLNHIFFIQFTMNDLIIIMITTRLNRYCQTITKYL